MTALTPCPALTLAEAVAICRAWNFGGRVKPCLHDVALAVVREQIPPVPFVPPPEWDTDEYEAAGDRAFEADCGYREWQAGNEEYQRMLRK